MVRVGENFLLFSRSPGPLYIIIFLPHSFRGAASPRVPDAIRRPACSAVPPRSQPKIPSCAGKDWVYASFTIIKLSPLNREDFDAIATHSPNRIEKCRPRFDGGY